jgi:hypothetical protein
MTTIQEIYYLYGQGRVRRIVREIDNYGPSFWIDLRTLLNNLIQDNEIRFQVFTDLCIAYEHGRAWITL